MVGAAPSNLWVVVWNGAVNGNMIMIVFMVLQADLIAV